MIEKISGIISKKISDYDGTIDDYDLHGWVAIVAAEAAQEIDALYQAQLAAKDEEIEALNNTIASVFKVAHEAIIRKGINTVKTMGEIIKLTEQP